MKDEDNCPTCDCLLPMDNTTEVNCSISTSCSPCHLGKLMKNKIEKDKSSFSLKVM